MTNLITIGSRVTVGKNPIIGIVVAEKNGKFEVKRPNPNGIRNMAHWVAADKVKLVAADEDFDQEHYRPTSIYDVLEFGTEDFSE